MEGCAICINLGRERCWSHDFEVPAAIEMLEPKIPIGEIAGSTLRRCPRCGIYYRYFYDTGIEDWSPYTQVELDRLTPAETLRTLTGDALTEYQAQYDAVLNRLRAEIDHPNARARALAAFDLMACAVERGPDWQTARALLRHADAVVRADSIAYLIGAAKAGVALSPLVEDLEALLDDRGQDVAARAADAVTWLYVKQRDSAAIARLLADARPGVLFAMTYKLWSSGESGLDVRPLVPRLRELLEHPNVNIREHADHILSRTPGQSPPLSTYLRHLSQGNAEQRNAALRALQLRAMQKTAPFASALPLLSKAAQDRKTEYLAIETLKSAAESGRDISTVLPALLRRLHKDPQSPRHTDIAMTLDHYLAKTGIRTWRQFLPALAAHLCHSNMQVRSTATRAFVAASAAGFDLSFAMAELTRAASTPDSFGEDAAKILARMGPRRSRHYRR